VTERENQTPSPGESTGEGQGNSEAGEASALAVSDPAAAAAEAEEPQNRRARRAAAARARKVRGQERAEAEAIGLGAQEILDEALTRSTDNVARWFRGNSSILQGIVAAGLVAWAGWGLYSWRSEVSKAQASDALAAAVKAGAGIIGEPEKQGQPNEQGVIDPTLIFKDAAARQKAAQAAFEQASRQRVGAPAAAYAELGLAATLLDDKQYDAAFTRFEATKNGEAAKSDAELKGRALEGMALALEGKNDLPGALKIYKELTNLGTSGFAAIGLYGQARMARATGDEAAARDAVTALNAKLAADSKSDAPAFGAPAGYLKQGAKLLSDVLGVVPPAPAAPAGGNPISQEQLQRLQREFQEKINQAGQKGSDGEK
jgi:predicted negative regulator of RcsB-dependent stress response